jgi:transposase
MPISCGIDWAEAHHDAAIIDAEGEVLARSRIGADVAGFTALVELITEHGGSPETTPVAIETDKNLLVVALAAAGFTVYPINPRAVSRYRERRGQAGGKSDAGDAVVLANILRTDRHVHRPLPASTEHARAIKALARQHQEAIWAMHQTISRFAFGAVGVLSAGGHGVSQAQASRRHHRAGDRADACCSQTTDPRPR